MSLLRVENVYKKFGGLTANQDFSRYRITRPTGFFDKVSAGQ